MKTATLEAFQVARRKRALLRDRKGPSTKASHSHQQSGHGVARPLRQRLDCRPAQIFVRQPFTESGNMEKESSRACLISWVP